MWENEWVWYCKKKKMSLKGDFSSFPFNLLFQLKLNLVAMSIGPRCCTNVKHLNLFSVWMWLPSILLLFVFSNTPLANQMFPLEKVYSSFQNTILSPLRVPGPLWSFKWLFLWVIVCKKVMSNITFLNTPKTFSNCTWMCSLISWRRQPKSGI